MSEPRYFEYFANSNDKQVKNRIKEVLHPMRFQMNADKGKNKLRISCYAPADEEEAKKNCPGGVSYTINSNDASYINFCPDFFQLPKFQDWKKAARAKSPDIDGMNVKKISGYSGHHHIWQGL